MEKYKNMNGCVYILLKQEIVPLTKILRKPAFLNGIFLTLLEDYKMWYNFIKCFVEMKENSRIVLQLSKGGFL